MSDQTDELTPEEAAAQDLADALEIAASPFGRHEALHTASLVLDMFDRHVLNHPAVEHADEQLRAQAEITLEALYDFYNLCGEKFLGMEEAGAVAE